MPWRWCSVFFEDGNVIHVHGKVDPRSDKETIETELILADLQSAEKSLEKAKRMAKSNDKDAVKTRNSRKIVQTLLEGKRVSTIEFSDEETPLLKEFSFLTAKPFLFVANVAEDALASVDIVKAKEILGLSESDELIPVSAK